jgi:hypothetical protein
MRTLRLSSVLVFAAWMGAAACGQGSSSTKPGTPEGPPAARGGPKGKPPKPGRNADPNDLLDPGASIASRLSADPNALVPAGDPNRVAACQAAVARLDTDRAGLKATVEYQAAAASAEYAAVVAAFQKARTDTCPQVSAPPPPPAPPPTKPAPPNSACPADIDQLQAAEVALDASAVMAALRDAPAYEAVAVDVEALARLKCEAPGGPGAPKPPPP